MSAGVHNPFAPRVKPTKKISKHEIGDFDTESHLGKVPPSVSLDGKNYVITFIGTDKVEDISDKLISLLYDVAKVHTPQLAKRGIYIGLRRVKEDERALTSKGRQITVYAPEDTSREEIIYNRIAHALLGIPIKNILAKHQVKLMERNMP
jgi:hypothetical protein